MSKREEKKLLREIETLRIALDESVKLQAHYAKLINMHDGGTRLIFPSASAWIARLKANGTIPK